MGDFSVRPQIPFTDNLESRTANRQVESGIVTAVSPFHVGQVMRTVLGRGKIVAVNTLTNQATVRLEHYNSTILVSAEGIPSSSVDVDADTAGRLEEIPVGTSIDENGTSTTRTQTHRVSGVGASGSYPYMMY